MAKATHANGPTFSDHELSDPTPPYAIQRAMLGVVPEREPVEEEGELVSVGTDSSESSSSEHKSSRATKQSPQEPAPSTENPSDPTATVPEGSSANSTGSAGRATTPRRSGKRPAAKQRPTGARATSLSGDDEFDEFD